MNLEFRKNTNDERLVLTLFDQGIDINATNYNECPLYLAAVNYNKPIIPLLLLNGVRCLSSVELFRPDKVMEEVEKGRSNMRDSISEMMKRSDTGEQRGTREKVLRQVLYRQNRWRKVEAQVKSNYSSPSGIRQGLRGLTLGVLVLLVVALRIYRTCGIGW